jgi:hypothetical protein
MKIWMTIAIVAGLTGPALAQTDPDTLTREDKALYLKCAYVINGGGTWGSTDLSDWSREELQKCIDPQPFAEATPPKPVKTAAVVPDPLPKADICRRHGKRKVMTRGGRSWRCR